MSSTWHWFVLIGTVVSLIGVMWLLFANRSVSGEQTTGHEWDGIQELDNPLPMWWVMGFVVSVIFSVIYLVIFPGVGNFAGVTNWSSAGEHDGEALAAEKKFAPVYARLADMSGDELAADKQAKQVGRRLFLNNCATCHGSTAKGSVGFPDLTDDEWIWGSSFDAIQASVLNGRSAQMPAWGAMLGNEGVTAVANRVRQMAGLEHDAELAKAGETHYNTICVACHGPEGKGNALLGAPDLTNDRWLYGNSLEAIAETVRNGRNGVMPAHAQLIGPDKVHIVAGYVYGLSKE